MDVTASIMLVNGAIYYIAVIPKQEFVERFALLKSGTARSSFKQLAYAAMYSTAEYVTFPVQMIELLPTLPPKE